MKGKKRKKKWKEEKYKHKQNNSKLNNICQSYISNFITFSLCENQELKNI